MEILWLRIEPLLSGSERGQIKAGLVKKYDPSLFDEENDDGDTGRICCLWDDEDFED